MSVLLVLAAAVMPAGLEATVRAFYADIARADNADPLWTRALVPSVRALEKRVTAASTGDVPDYLDADWLCQCQDPAGLKIASLASAPGPSGTTIVTVRFGVEGRATDRVWLVMVRDHGWKIADVIDKSGMRYTYALRYNLRPHRR